MSPDVRTVSLAETARGVLTGPWFSRDVRRAGLGQRERQERTDGSQHRTGHHE